MIKYTVVKLWVLLLVLMVSLMFVYASPNQPDNRTVGYSLIDGETFHMWNWHDDYYINLSSGIQLTNHINEYWALNTWCLGHRRVSWVWLCTDIIPFDWDYYTDNETYVYLVGYYETQGAFKLNMSLTYELDNSSKGDMINMTVFIKNKGNRDFNDPVGFRWIFTDIKINNSYDNNYININSTRNLSGLNYTYLNWTGQQIFIERPPENIQFDFYKNANVYVEDTGSPNSDVTIELIWDEGLPKKENITHLMRWHDAGCTVDFISEVPPNFDQLADDAINFDVGGVLDTRHRLPGFFKL